MKKRKNDKIYGLNSGIRVRKEAFGLLFYDAKIPQLIFVHSGEWIQPDFFTKEISVSAVIEERFTGLTRSEFRNAEKGLNTLLEKLVGKGLIFENVANS